MNNDPEANDDGVFELIARRSFLWQRFIMKLCRKIGTPRSHDFRLPLMTLRSSTPPSPLSLTPYPRLTCVFPSPPRCFWRPFLSPLVTGWTTAWHDERCQVPRFSYPSNLPYAKYTALTTTTHACIRNEIIVDEDIKEGEDRNRSTEIKEGKRET